VVATYIKLILATFFWGATFVAAKWAVREAHPVVVGLTRFAISALALFIMLGWKAWGRGGSGCFPVPRTTHQWLNVFSLGLTGVFLYNVFFLTGIQWTTVINGSLILATNPMLTAALSSVWLKERIRPIQIAGFLLSFLGVATVVTRGSWEVIHHISFNTGDILILGSSMSFAYYSVRGKTILNEFSPLAATSYACLFGALLFLVLAFVYSLPMPGISTFSYVGWLAIFQLSFLSTFLGFVWWYEGVKRIGAGRSGVFFNLVTVFAISLATVFLDEQLQWPQVLGGIFVIGGVYLGTTGGDPSPGVECIAVVDVAPGPPPPAAPDRTDRAVR
jgi:drug/metabolite transporter (DMT)-like permease